MDTGAMNGFVGSAIKFPGLRMSKVNKGSQQFGFSLIELMVTVTVVGILSAIVYPAYLSQMQKARRVDAKVGLTQAAQQLERCFTEFNVYNSVNCGIVGASQTVNLSFPDASHASYTIKSKDAGNAEHLTALGTALVPAYVLYATPTGAQASDSCGIFSLDGWGNKTPTTSGCWE